MKRIIFMIIIILFVVGCTSPASQELDEAEKELFKEEGINVDDSALAGQASKFSLSYLSCLEMLNGVEFTYTFDGKNVKSKSYDDFCKDNSIVSWYCGENFKPKVEGLDCGKDTCQDGSCVEVELDEELVEEEIINESELDNVSTESDDLDIVEENVHTVIINDTGYYPGELTISVDNTVVWENDRSTSSAMVLGNGVCVGIDQVTINTGESFEWTFTEPMTCTITDGILVSTPASRIIVE